MRRIDHLKTKEDEKNRSSENQRRRRINHQITKKGDVQMVKHVILWQLKDELSAEDKEKVKAEIKAGLEGLADQIPGLIDIKVNTQGLSSSNADLMLDSSFEDEASLKGYAVHPAHVAVADGVVRPNTKSRVCLDYLAE